MSTRRFLLPVAALAALNGGQTEAQAKPHIVVYLSDDHSQFDSGAYGNANIPTPNMRELAADGMTFTHGFVASPSCAPSRAAMLTGLMPARNGAEANHTKPKPGYHSLIKDLNTAGYETAAFGKVAHGKYAAEFGFGHVNRQASVANLRRNVRRFLAARRSAKPLALFVGTSNPHVPWPKESSFDPAEVKFPPHHLDTPATRRHRAAYYQEIKDLDAYLGELRKLAARHLGKNVLFIHTSDHGSQWPFGKWTLYDYGTRVPLLAAWPGVIRPGAKTAAMVSWVDLLPTVIDAAGGKVPAGLDGRSFLPVLKGGRAGHRDVIFTTHTGDGRKNIYPSRAARTRDWKLIHNLHPEFAFTNHSDLDQKPLAGAFWPEWAELAKTDPKAKRIVNRYYRRPEFELYNVTNDKWELNNLAGDPRHAGRLASMKQRLKKWMRQQGDNGKVHTKPRLLNNPQDWRPEFYPTATPKRGKR